VLEVGQRIPDAQVWTAPRETVTIRDLADEGPILLAFFLFDWSST
jgi:peroxiredoxin